MNEPLLDPLNPEGIENIIDFTNVFRTDYGNEGKDCEAFYDKVLKNPKNIERLLRTDLNKGLTTTNQETMKWREILYGNNHLPPDDPVYFLTFVIECFEDPTLQILLVASIVSLIIGLLKDGIKTGWIEGTAIFAAVFLVVSISSYLNYNKQLQFEKLNHEIKMKNVIVIRDGNETEINFEDVLVGDILALKIGDIVCVDGILFSGQAQMDESAVNGESEFMRKGEEFQMNNSHYITPVILSGTQVQDGKGLMIVCAVGEKSCQGRSKLLMKANQDEDSEENQTPLKKQLDDLTNLIGNFGYIMASLIGLLLIIKQIVLKVYNGQPVFDGKMIDIFVNAFILAVTVVVVAIPEGLPMAVTIALAYSVQKMKDEHNLVKHLDKSETMGNVNNVCTDKTGTLTKGVMSVDGFYFQGTEFRVADVRTLNESQKNIIFNCVYKNITVVKSINDHKEEVLSGDMTEKALYYFLSQNEFVLTGKNKGEFTLPFKSEYKYMMTIYSDENGYVLYAKGAPERLMPLITLYNSRKGNTDIKPYEQEIQQIQAHYANDTKRTLLFASKTLSKAEIDKAIQKYPEKDLPFYQELAQGLVFQFMVGIRDPFRDDVPQAIQKCHAAGITIRMITGDNLLTAMSISKNVGIIDSSEFELAKNISNNIKAMLKDKKEADLSLENFESPIAVEGEQFRILSGDLKKAIDPDTKKVLSIDLNNIDRFRKTVSRLKIIARASPEDKFLLVYGLKKLENIVAVTGDGTNDAPALKQAHVGFAMGIRGTDIAKEAADIVLLDDSFSSIVTACKYGRNVYDCIRKFIQFQLTTNVVAVFMTLLGGVILKDAPLNAIQMLWVNLIMDSFASLALATESPSEELLKRKPYNRDASLLTPMMKLNIFTQSIFQMIILIIILFYGDIMFGVPSDRELEHFTWNNVNGYHFTIFFNTFVFMQVFNSINARKLTQKEFNVFSGILGNWYYLLVQFTIVFGQIMLVTFGGRAVRTHPLNYIQHLECIGIASLTLLCGVIIKLLPVDTTEPEVGEERRVEESLGVKLRGGSRRYTDVMPVSRNKSKEK